LIHEVIPYAYCNSKTKTKLVAGIVSGTSATSFDQTLSS